MKPVRVLPVAAVLLAAFVLVSPLTLNAQQAVVTATPIASPVVGSTVPGSSVIITSPPLVSELHGTVQVMGTANLTGMRSFFLETRTLNPDAGEPTIDTPWVPATLPATNPVQNGILASWDTTLIPDGLYELRLTVTGSSSSATYFVVTPLRINNAAFMASTAVPTSSGAAATGTPTVTAQLSANVRVGDTVYARVVGRLLRGSNATVLGISGTGSGWLYIQLSDGTKGWIAPNVVVKSGDFGHVPIVYPPLLPTFTPTAIPSGLVLNGIALKPVVPVCGVTFTVAVNVNNAGKSTSRADSVYFRDIDQRLGTVTASAVVAIPALNPGANFVVTVPLLVTTYYNEIHVVQATVDGNQITTGYTLAQGGCNK